jgi:hypothetical protein
MLMLSGDKEKNIANHFMKLLESYAKMEEGVNQALTESVRIGAGDTSLLELFKTIVKLRWTSSLRPQSRETIDFVKSDFYTRQDAFNEIRNALGNRYGSFLKDIDKQLNIAGKAITAINAHFETEVKGPKGWESSIEDSVRGLPHKHVDSEDQEEE